MDEGQKEQKEHDIMNTKVGSNYNEHAMNFSILTPLSLSSSGYSTMGNQSSVSSPSNAGHVFSPFVDSVSGHIYSIPPSVDQPPPTD